MDSSGEVSMDTTEAVAESAERRAGVLVRATYPWAKEDLALTWRLFASTVVAPRIPRQRITIPAVLPWYTRSRARRYRPNAPARRPET